MTPSVKQYVLRLKISVDYITTVQLLDCDQDLGEVEDRVFESEAQLLFDLLEQLASI